MVDELHNRLPRSSTHVALGALLRDIRVQAGLRTRDLGFASGHVSNVENGHATPSRDLIEVYLRIGGDHSAVMALFDEIQHNAHSSADERRRKSRAAIGRPSLMAPGVITDRTNADDVRRHYKVERYDVRFDFNAIGGIASVTSQVALKAVTDEVRFYYTGHMPDESRRRDLDIRVLSGGNLERVTIGALGAADIFIRLNQVLSPQDTQSHMLRYQILLDGSERAEPSVLYFTRPGVQHHRVTATFTAPVVPRRIWRVAGPDPLVAERVAPESELPSDPRGRYEQLFDHIIPGWCYGLMWIWSGTDSPAGIAGCD